MFDINTFMPRIHQEELNKQTYNIGEKDITIALKTGLGKTKLYLYNAHYEENVDKKMLFIVPEISLAWQTKIQSDMGILQGSSKEGLDKRLHVGVIHTVTNMEGKHKGTKSEIKRKKDIQLAEFLNQYDEIWIDEAHDQIPRQERIRKLFKGFMRYLTATPYNGNGEWLDHLKTTSVIGLDYSYKWAKENGYMIPTVIYTAGNLDTSDLNQTEEGDFIDAEIMEKIENSDIDIFDTVKQKINGKYPTITMCQNKAHAQKLADDFTKRGIKTHALYSGCEIDIELPFGETKRLKGKKATNYILSGLKEGTINHITFVKMLIKGVDAPILGNIVIATKTTNIAVLAQLLGRGVRPYDPISHMKEMIRRTGAIPTGEDLEELVTQAKMFNVYIPTLDAMSHCNIIDIFGSMNAIGFNPLDFKEPKEKKPKKSKRKTVKCMACRTRTPLKIIEDYVDKSGNRVVIKKCQCCGEEDIKVDTPPVIFCRKCNIASLATETVTIDRVVYSVCPHCGDKEEMSRVYPRELVLFDEESREQLKEDILHIINIMVFPPLRVRFTEAYNRFKVFAENGHIEWLFLKLISRTLSEGNSLYILNRMVEYANGFSYNHKNLLELCNNNYNLFHSAMEIVEHTRIERVINKLRANKRNNNKLPIEQQISRYKKYIIKEKGA